VLGNGRVVEYSTLLWNRTVNRRLNYERYSDFSGKRMYAQMAQGVLSFQLIAMISHHRSPRLLLMIHLICLH
jgi:hypothetical protein